MLQRQPTPLLFLNEIGITRRGKFGHGASEISFPTNFIKL
jgi:hypothetical protein